MYETSLKRCSHTESKEGKSNVLCAGQWMMKNMTELCEEIGLDSTCSAENVGHESD